MKTEKTEGIVLHITNFQEKDKIIKIFSKDDGIISVFLKNKKNSAISTFYHLELVYQKKKSDLFLLKEENVLDENFGLREKLININSACVMTKAIIDSQFNQKRSYPIYLLFKTYLKKIPTFSNPKILASSFLLKLLLFEGFLHLDSDCNVCQKKASHLFGGESLCPNHAPNFSFSFLEEEYEILEKLTFCKKFSDLQNIKISDKLFEKINSLFQDTL